MSADTIFINGSVLTMEPALPRAAAIAVTNGRISCLGAQHEVLADKGPDTEIVDLAGGTLLPGFIEAHGHPLTEALYVAPAGFDVRPLNCPTYAELISKVRSIAAEADKDALLFFRGLDLVLHRVPHDPTRRDLDDWAPDVAIVMQANSGHATWANSKALARLGIDRDTPDPVAGHYLRDKSGELTGKATEAGTYTFLAPLFNGDAQSYRDRSLGKVFAQYASRGLTTVSDQAMQSAQVDQYRKMAASCDIPVRIRGYLRGNQGAVTGMPGQGDDAFRIIGVKLTADGSPWVGNIAVSDPYLNSEVTLRQMGLPRDNRGHLNWTDERMTELVEQYAGQGWQISVHAHGDVAIEQVLDAFEKVILKVGRPDHRWRLEHCGTITDAQIDKAVRLGVVVSFFPTHVYWWGEALRHDLFNLPVAERWMAMGSAVRRGMKISLHNDGMVTPANPLLNLRTAVTRLTQGGNVLGAQQCITIDQALRAQTIDAAWQLFMEDETGSVKVGKSADLVWLSDDPTNVAPEQLNEIDVCGTWLRGKQTYGR